MAGRRRNSGASRRWWPLLPCDAEVCLLPVPRGPAWRPGQMALPTPGGSGLSTPSHCPPTCPAWAPVITRLLRIEGTNPSGEVPLSPPREIRAWALEVTVGGGVDPGPPCPLWQLRPQRGCQAHKPLFLWNRLCFLETLGPCRTPPQEHQGAWGHIRAGPARITPCVQAG